jgi:SAM-dependent methyltransferase
MNWKLKAHAMALLSRFPGGSHIYHKVQACLRSNHLPADEGVARAVEIAELIREAGGTPEDGVYVEIGTGWRPFLPFLLYLAGARRVISFDVNPWLNRAYAFETYRALADHLDTIANRLHLSPNRVRARYHRVASLANDLTSLLSAFGLEYRCPADARQTGLADQSIDFVCSSNVLEHIPPTTLRQIHHESARILRPGGLAIHRFNPGDHYSSVDASITGVHFLRYSERQWHWYGGSGLSYHNRLRCIQHRHLLEEAGFAVLIDRVRMDQHALDLLKRQKVAIHPDFARFSHEQLAADYMWVVGMRPATIPLSDKNRTSAHLGSGLPVE